MSLSSYKNVSLRKKQALNHKRGDRRMKVVLQDLTKIFPARKKGGTDTVAVDHFTYEIPDGKLIGLLGPLMGAHVSQLVRHMILYQIVLARQSGKLRALCQRIFSIVPQRGFVFPVQKNFCPKWKSF